jgi:hypothetical protein
VDDDGRIFIEAKRKIMLGEELTYHYGKWYFETYIKDAGCRCVKCHNPIKVLKKKAPAARKKSSKKTSA